MPDKVLCPKCHGQITTAALLVMAVADGIAMYVVVVVKSTRLHQRSRPFKRCERASAKLFRWGRGKR